MESNTADGDKLIFLYGSSPSASQPLLHNASPQSAEPYPRPEETRRTNEGSDPSQYLQISYSHTYRPWKDVAFLILFLVLVLLTFGFGIFAVANRNASYYDVSSYAYDANTASCVKENLSLSKFPSVYFSFLGYSSDSEFLRALIWVLVVTLLLAVPICFLLLLCLKRYTKQVVYVCLPFFVILPAFFNIYCFVVCTVSSTCRVDFPLAYRILVLLFVLVVIGVIVWIIVANWHKVELTSAIIGIASDALSKNLGLFIALPLMTMGLAVYYTPIVVFLVFARLNGKIIVQYSGGEYNCEWKQNSWVPAYFALGIITMLWSLTSMMEAQIYVISGAVAQWYFSKAESAPKKNVRSSLRNAFGPSAGTICLSGLLIAAVRVVRAAVESTREDTSGIVARMLRCCVNACLSAIDFVNKFTIIFVAITGEAYCASAKMTYELLRRNLLSAAFVETISTRLLAGIAFVVSAIFAVAVCAILEGVSELRGASYLIAVLAGLLLLVILGYVVRVLDTVIEVVYVCYAIDRDKGDVCKPEVHDIYVQLPINRSHSPSGASLSSAV